MSGIDPAADKNRASRWRRARVHALAELIKSLLVLPLSIALASMTACGGATTASGATTPRTSSGSGSLRDIDWQNRTYEVDQWRVTLRDGLYESQDGPDTHRSISVLEPIVYGDVTGDGVDEAVVILFSSETAGPPDEVTTSAGIDVSMQVLIYAQAGFGEPPRLLGVIYGQEDELRIERASIANGVVSVFGQRNFEPDEERYRWDGSAIVRVE